MSGYSKRSKDCPVEEHGEIKLFGDVLGLLASFCYHSPLCLGHSGTFKQAS